MQSVVAAGLGVGGAAALLVGLQQRLVPLGQNMSDHHGCASRQSSLGEKSPGHVAARHKTLPQIVKNELCVNSYLLYVSFCLF